MRFWVGVSAAFAAGGLFGAGLTRILVEDKLKKEYEESVASMRRVLLAQKIDVETPVHSEEDLLRGDIPVVVQPRGDGTQLEGGPVEFADRIKKNQEAPKQTFESVPPKPADPRTNPYHTPVVQTALVSYAELEEEDYYEEDGRVKEQITMVYADDVPMFFQGNEQIEDWMERLGGTIVDDMRNSVREGNPIVYIRNNQTDVDYEVVFDQP